MIWSLLVCGLMRSVLLDCCILGGFRDVCLGDLVFWVVFAALDLGFCVGGCSLAAIFVL